MKPVNLKEFCPQTDISIGVMAAIREEYGSVLPNVDSYKLSHSPLYDEEATMAESYIESRGGRFERILMGGLQPWLIDSLARKITKRNVKNMARFAKAHGEPFDEACWLRVVEKYDGRLPIYIKAIPEGTLVPTGVPIIKIGSKFDDHDVISIVSYIETSILRVWATITVGTISNSIRRVCIKNLMKTSDDPYAALMFMLNDFGSRGVSSSETSAYSGMGQLYNFLGSDNILSIIATQWVYQNEMPGFSIPASEHSVMCSGGRKGEYKMLKKVLDTYAKPGAIVACVIDTYQMVDFIRNYVSRPEIVKLIKESKAHKIVFRPDTNDPVITPVWVVQELEKIFGSTTNSKGYKVLNYVGVIQGDSIDESKISKIQDMLIERGFCVSNIVFGMGGKLLQAIDRDTQKFAMKACAYKLGGTWSPVAKDPVSVDYKIDPATLEIEPIVTLGSFKKSKAGQVTTLKSPTGEFIATTEDVMGEYLKQGYTEALQLVYDFGEFYNFSTLDEIRERIKAQDFS